jgi:hypothetical protein
MMEPAQPRLLPQADQGLFVLTHANAGIERREDWVGASWNSPNSRV